MADHRSGFYIAHHPWLDKVLDLPIDISTEKRYLYKVGHTGDLRQRLTDSAYTTCYSPGWRYVLTLELDSKKEACRLETAVLYCCRHHRLGSRELIALPAKTIGDLACSLARSLGLKARIKEFPLYEKTIEKKVLDGDGNDRREYPGAFLSSEDKTKINIFTLSSHTSAEISNSYPFQHEKRLSGPECRGGDQEKISSLQSPNDALHPFQLREYQEEASTLCLEELKRNHKAILQMACRCGKTPVAHNIMLNYFLREGSPKILFLVPSLALLRQTYRKLMGYGLQAKILLVGSDPRPVVNENCDISRSSLHENGMTTSSETIYAFFYEREKRGRLVLSTYQSSPLLSQYSFDLTIFDESHRICGSETLRPFNHILLKTGGQRGDRLFMTATPAYEGEISMKDQKLFGGIAYRYYLRQGISAGYVNDFSLQLVASPPEDSIAPEESALPFQICEAMQRVDKLLVFCRDINHAIQISSSLRDILENFQKSFYKTFHKKFEVLIAHSRLSSAEIGQTIKKFSMPGARMALLNCRLFQEGVEFPSLNGVFFAAPRHSPRDIIQSMCRPLNKYRNKPPSVIFIPILYDPRRAVNDPINLQRFASIIPFVDALISEDPRLFEHLLNPETPYPIECIGTHSLGLTDASARCELIRAVRRVIRHGVGGAPHPGERLLKIANLPWDVAFAELRRVVSECRRYPKTTDLLMIGQAKVSFHSFYKFCTSQYKAYVETGVSKLEPFQLRALETLEAWEPFGLEGPYPWKICIDFLEKWLEENNGVPPMLEINKGGYVGLDATLLERLSGAMTCINQQVFGKKIKGGKISGGDRVPADHARDLDRICTRFGLRWRKIFKEDQTVDQTKPTFIQEAYRRFKEYVRMNSTADPFIQTWWPGYPKKHEKQEKPELERSKLPPRRVARRTKRNQVGISKS